MKKTLIILLLFSSKLIGQNFNIKWADTIYLQFDTKKEFENLHFKILDNNSTETYVYQFPDNKALSFRYYKNEKQNITRSKKSVEKNKLKFISIEFMQKNGYYRMLNSLYNPERVIYLISKKNIKRNKIILKKVFMENVPGLDE